MNPIIELIDELEIIGMYVSIDALIDDEQLNDIEYNCYISCVEQLFTDLASDKRIVKKNIDGKTFYAHPNVVKRFDRNFKIEKLLNENKLNFLNKTDYDTLQISFKK